MSRPIDVCVTGLLLAVLAAVLMSAALRSGPSGSGAAESQAEDSDLATIGKSWPVLRARSLDDATIRIFTDWRAGRLAYHLFVDRYPRAVRTAREATGRGRIVIMFQNQQRDNEVAVNVPLSDLTLTDGGLFRKGSVAVKGEVPLQQSQYARLDSWRMAWLLPGRTPIMLGQSEGVRLKAGDRRPTLVEHVRPVYPDAAREAGVGGLVIVSFVVGADGTVMDATIRRSIPLLDQAALDAVKQWRFEPAIAGGVAVSTKRVTALTFP